MAGTNAAAAKKALIDALDALTGTGGSLADVQVAYSFPGRTLQREVIYGGVAAGPLELSAMRGSGRVKRIERPLLELHILVTDPGHDTTEVTDARAAEIGAVIEELLAADPTIGGVAGLKAAVAVGLELDGGVDDDGAESVLTYRIELLSYLT